MILGQLNFSFIKQMSNVHKFTKYTPGVLLLSLLNSAPMYAHENDHLECTETQYLSISSTCFRLVS